MFRNGEFFEVVVPYYVNGGFDYSHRMIKLLCGSKVTLEAMPTVYKRFRFAFWQKEEAPHYGLMLTNRTIVVNVKHKLEIWWINYVEAET